MQKLNSFWSVSAQSTVNASSLWGDMQWGSNYWHSTLIIGDADNDGVLDASDTFPLNTKYRDDTDRDGLPDRWETRYSLDTNSASDANADTDLDGVSNLDEFYAGTNPTYNENNALYSDSSWGGIVWGTDKWHQPEPLVDSDGDGYTDNIDAFPHNSLYALDQDNDQIPDQLELARIGSLSILGGTNSDVDGDGITDLEEFNAGTDPLTYTVLSRFTEKAASDAEAYCKASPSSCGISQTGYSESEVDQRIAEAIEACKIAPSICGITTTGSGGSSSASYTYTMLDGWNLIGGKDASGTEAIAQFLQDQEAESAWDWSEDDRTWKSFIIGVPDFINSLNEMSVDSGYFIYKAPPESSSE